MQLTEMILKLLYLVNFINIPFQILQNIILLIDLIEIFSKAIDNNNMELLQNSIIYAAKLAFEMDDYDSSGYFFNQAVI